MDLQPYIDRDNFNTADYWPFTWQETLYEGDSYGIPFETDVRVLIWNKQALADVGPTRSNHPRPGMSWRPMLMPLTSKTRMALTNVSAFSHSGMPASNFGPAPTAGNRSLTANQTIMIQPLLKPCNGSKIWVDRYGGWQELQNFKASYGSPPNDIFMSGAVPMIVDVAGYLSQLNFYRPQAQLADGSSTAMEWGISYIPYREARANWSGGFALAIPKGAANPDAAWEVIKCMAGPEGQASWSRDTLAIPTLQTLADDPVLTADPYWEEIMNVMQDSQGSTYVPEYPNFTQEVNTRYEQVWTGEVTPEQMAEQAQQAIDDVMAQNQ
ncbi:MAG: extracellular solute-binding protein [Caldilineaceae bacterium]